MIGLGALINTALVVAGGIAGMFLAGSSPRACKTAS